MGPLDIVRKLEFGDWCLVGIMVLQAMAILGYAYKKRWLDATVYLGYFCAQCALLILAIRAR